jgi:hypothetical protein
MPQFLTATNMQSQTSRRNEVPGHRFDRQFDLIAIV